MFFNYFDVYCFYVAYVWNYCISLSHRPSVKLHLRDERTNGQTPGIEFGSF